MAPRLDPFGVPAIAQTAAVSAIEAAAKARQQGGQPSLASLLGKTLPAQVLARLGADNFLVTVAGAAWRMALPASTRVGAQLPLTLLQAGDEPTFALDAARGGAFHRITATAAAALPAPALPAPALPGQEAQLSSGARVLAALLRTAGAAPDTAALTGSAPLAPQASQTVPDPAQLAERLRLAISQSGLFYESHVAEWAEGKRSLAELAREPQMQRTPGSPLADPESAQFVNLQLTTQEQARLAWHGQLAPGQPFEWQIDKEPQGQAQAGEPPTEEIWRSELRLRFALLGEIGASVVLRGGQVQVALRPASSAARALLQAHTDRLDAGLAGAGTPLCTLTIAALPQAHE